MKKLISSLLSILVLAALSFFVLDEAYAVPPVLGGGGIKNNYKQAPNTNLVCNFADPRSYVEINYTEYPPSFTMETPGERVVICKEFDRTTGKAVTGDIEFTLTQIGMNTCDLKVTQVYNDDGTRTVTWEFIVGYGGGCEDPPELEWDLRPVNQYDPICVGNFGDCVNKMGVPPVPILCDGSSTCDFPERTVGGETLGQNVVFRYTELQIPSGEESFISLPGKLILGPCHSGSFNPDDEIACVKDGNPTTTEGVVPGMVPSNDGLPVKVEFVPETINVVKSRGMLDIFIFGPATLNLSKGNDLLDNLLEVNGTLLRAKTMFAYSSRFGSLLWVRVDRPAFADALQCFGNGPTRVNVTGILESGTLFNGFETISVLQCPNK